MNEIASATNAWRPIETVPLERRVLVCDRMRQRVYVATKHRVSSLWGGGSVDMWSSDETYFPNESNLVGWLPLPEGSFE